MDLIDTERLVRLLGGEDLDWLVARVRRRLERGESLDTSVTLANATPPQRAAVDRLLGRPPRAGGTVTVSLPAVDRVLRDSGACPGGLAAAVVALTGEISDRQAVASAHERAWQVALTPLAELVAARPELAGWFEHLGRTGVVRRLAGTAEAAAPLIAVLAEVLRRLPADGEQLGHFAARVVGRSHALDDDRPLATLLLSAARSLSGLPDGAGAQWRREVLASVGLLRDELSSTVLTLGLPGDDRTPTGRALAVWSAVGQPVVLTLRQLVSDPRQVPAGQVFICENPVVVSAAAERLGPGCAPLVCTSGQPGVAAVQLLRRLADGGCRLRYHGDFDWGGVRIGNVVFNRLPVEPWRFQTADYLAYATRGHQLTGAPVEAAWDGGLSAAMRTEGVAIEEEQVLEELLHDLAL
ncbi:MAG TPA: TIGR02679 family protein [Kribbellaceae bacterium]|nr:TIGR02679 family protein [Kribbellaceae bacterium]